VIGAFCIVVLSSWINRINTIDNSMTKQSLVVSNDQKTANKKVQLVFHKPKGIDAYLLNDLSIYTGRDFFQLFCAVTSEVVEWFDDFTIHLIEVWINSIIQTEHETKLIVEGKGIKSHT
jgi:hypothetical protein